MVDADRLSPAEATILHMCLDELARTRPGFKQDFLLTTPVGVWGVGGLVIREVIADYDVLSEKLRQIIHSTNRP
jgi:hypothetical protein